jgi:tryptophan 2-monooxygenase
MPFHWNLAEHLSERFGSSPIRGFTSGAAASPAPYIDTLYDYHRFMKDVGGKGIAAFPDQAPHSAEAAIIGAGPSGLVAAYELVRIGIRPVIYEASERIGGRLWSQPFCGNSAIAEMGAMRFPSTALFDHYIKLFGLRFGGIFPNPGRTRTGLYYQNTYYDWVADARPPGPFAKIREDWLDFIGNLGVLELHELLRGGEAELKKAETLWQQLINKFANTSFVAAVSDGIPKWGTAEFTAFGALGIGTGGFGPLYHNGFLEFIRLIVNGLESNQQLLLDGISGLSSALATSRPKTADGDETPSLEESGAIKLRRPVVALESIAGPSDRPRIRLWFDHDHEEFRDFDAVIVATSTRSMQMMGMTLAESKPVLGEEARTSLRNLHLVDSSKLFIRTKRKFWLDDLDVPTNIQTDEMPRGIYCLDYEDRSENGVVLVSYTWGDDSTKLLPMSGEERFRTFRDILRRIHPKFASYLEPVDGEILHIDWQLTPHQYGAFKLQYPSQERYARDAYYQYLSVLDPAQNRGVYLAGDSISWAGGWVESALQTGINAACALARHLGAVPLEGSPLTQDPDRYSYEGV